MEKIKASVLETIGNTPLIELKRLQERYQVQGRLLAKLEMVNPTASKKDRIALHLIEQAEKDGRLVPGQTVVEVTSGNTGNSLAMVCAVKGYRFVAAMSRGNSVERVKMMRGLGAELLLVDQAPGSQKGVVCGTDLEMVERAAEKFAAEENAYLTNQFYNSENSEAHYLTTAREIWQQTDGKVDFFADFAGTGGSFDGCAHALKQLNSQIKCMVVEPQSAAYYGAGVTDSKHMIQGGGYGKKLDLIDSQLVDGSVAVSDEDAVKFARELASVEGVFAGYSSGANVCAGISLLQGAAKGKTVVILICDSGLKYLSTALFDFE